MYLTLFPLNHGQHFLCEIVILRPGVREHVNKGVRQGDVYCLLDGADGHFRAVPASLDVQVP